MDTIVQVFSLPWAVSISIGVAFSYGIGWILNYPLSLIVPTKLLHAWLLRLAAFIAGTIPVVLTWPSDFPVLTGMAVGMAVPGIHGVLGRFFPELKDIPAFRSQKIHTPS